MNEFDLKEHFTYLDECESSKRLFKYLRSLDPSVLIYFEKEFGARGLAFRWSCDDATLKTIFRGARDSLVIKKKLQKGELI